MPMRLWLPRHDWQARFSVDAPNQRLGSGPALIGVYALTNELEAGLDARGDESVAMLAESIDVRTGSLQMSQAEQQLGESSMRQSKGAAAVVLDVLERRPVCLDRVGRTAQGVVGMCPLGADIGPREP